MRSTRFISEDEAIRLGLDLGDGTAEPLDGALFGPLRPTGERLPIRRRLAPLTPANIFCIGLNYHAHALETGPAVSEHPVLFMKRDEIPNPQALAIRGRINGERMQEGHTSDMIFPVARVIAELSRDTTLLPGTLIPTGTPPGMGAARNSPRFLADGDRVGVEIERIGILSNPVQSAR